MSLKSIHIIMVTWNALEYTKFALDSLFTFTDVPFYLTIVDNNSSDETQKYLDNLKPDNKCIGINVIKNAYNVGYGDAINQAYNTRKSKLVCVVNNDVFFSPNWLGSMVADIESDPMIGILGCMRPLTWCKHPYCNQSTDSVLENLSNSLSPIEELTAYCHNKKYEDFVKDLKSTNNFGIRYFTGPPIHIVTCCALVRSEIIDKIGGLSDSSFKIFGAEDTDLSWRISTNGYRLAVTSSAYVHHFKHKSSDASNLDRIKHCKENNEVFYKKWHETLHKFLKQEIDNGVDVDSLLSNEDDYSYWFLRRLKSNIGSDKFWGDVRKT
jgi:GT2 family glycosyltransferase